MIANNILLVTAGAHVEEVVTTAVNSCAQLTVTPTIEALERLRDREIDALVMTGDLTSSDPLNLVREIRREFPTLPMGFISEANSGVLASEALAAGVDDYIPLSVVSAKPDRLQSGLNRAVQARSLSDPSDELTALHTATQEMIAADSVDALANRVVEASRDVLELDYAAVYRIEDGGPTLVPAAWTEQLQEAIDELPSLNADSLAWPAFINSSSEYYADVSAVEETPTIGTTFRTAYFLPLGDHGLLAVFSPEHDVFNSSEREIISILGANATAALTSIAQAAELPETAQTLQSQNEQLDQFVKQATVDCILPNFETQQNNVLRECIVVFGELRGVSRDGSACQMDRLLSKSKNLRLREGFHLVELRGDT